MARNITAMKRGWNYDVPNTALKAMVDGVKGFQLVKDAGSQFAIMKLGSTPTAEAASQVDGSGVALLGSRTCALEVNADTGSTNLNGDYYVSGIKGNVVLGTASSNASIIGVLGKLNTNTANFGSGQHFAVRGHTNFWGSSTLAGAGNYTGGLSAYLEHEGTTTVSSGNVLCGVDVYSVGGTISNSGTVAGIYIRANATTAPWQYGIYIPIEAGVSVTPSEAAIQVGNPTRSAAGQVDGNSFACTASRAAACEIHADTGSTNLNGDYYVASIYGDFIMGTSASNATMIGVLGKLNTNTAAFKTGHHYAVRGHLNIWGNMSMSGAGNFTGGIQSYIENEGTTTVGAGTWLIGLDVYQVGAPTVTGYNPAIYIRSNTTAARWQTAILVDGSDIGIDMTCTNTVAFRAGSDGLTGGGGDVYLYAPTASYRVLWDDDADTNKGTWYFGQDTYGIDVAMYGQTTGQAAIWDASDARLEFNGADLNLQDDDILQFGDSQDIAITWHSGGYLLITQATVDSLIRWGVDGAGMDQIWYGDTSGSFMRWDQSADTLRFYGSDLQVRNDDYLHFGDQNDISIRWYNNYLVVTQANEGSTIRWGVDGAGMDIIWYGDTSGNYMMWDQSLDALKFSATAKLILPVKVSGSGVPGDIWLDTTDSKIHFADYGGTERTVTSN